MWKFLVDNLGVIFIAILTFLIGIVLGFSSKPDADGIFFNVTYSGGRVTIGKTVLSISDVDISTLDVGNESVLINKIEGLSSEHTISRDLRTMVRNAIGPFEGIEMTMKFHLVDDESMNGEKAMACRGSLAYDSAILARSPLESNEELIKTFKAYLSKDICVSEEINDIWVSKSYVEDWLGPMDENENPLSLNVILVVSSI